MLAAISVLSNSDAANKVIAFVLLAGGVLGVLFYLAAMLVTPLPRTAEAGAPEAYPRVDRFVVPLLLPVGVAALIALIIFFMSQILLSLPEAVAWPAALVIALIILLVCAGLAGMRRVTRELVYSVIAVPAVIFLIAGVVATAYQHRSTATAKTTTASSAPQATTTPMEVTTDNQFSATTITIPAGQSVTLTQVNKGQALHNWHVLDATDANGKPIMTQITNPGQTSKVTFTITKPGTYHFHCDVHPAEMTGTLNVVAASGVQAGAAQPASTTPTEVTTDNKFSATTITIPAGKPVTLTQDNKGQALHNWHVIDAMDANGKPIMTQITNPGQTSKVTFTITKPGTYHFVCDVHPAEMTGTLIVQ